jgi:glycosyltransferase involved in cell wall biosynthesis
MNLLLAINGTDFGGTETLVAQLASRLSRKGHRVTVLSLKHPGRLGRRLEQGGVPVSTLGMSEDVGLAALLTGSVRLAFWLRRHDFDAIHSFLPRANIMTRIANRLSGRRRLHLSNEESTDFRRSRTVVLLNRVTAPWTDRFYAVSPGIKDVLMVRERLPGSRIEVLENTIDLGGVDEVKAADLTGELGVPVESFFFGSVGRLTRVKGHVFLLRAFARIHQQRPETRLLIVGEGPEEAALLTVANELGIEPCVHFLGFREDVVSILKSIDVFVLPSLQEGLPVTVLEAMACLLPIVATRVGGVPGAVVDGQTGLLVPPPLTWAPEDESGVGDRAESDQGEAGVDSLVEAMGRLLDDDGLRARLGQNARERAERQYSFDRAVRHLEETYRSGCRSTTGSRRRSPVSRGFRGGRR